MFFDELKKQKKISAALCGVRVAAIGQGTASALEQRGLLADLVPSVYDGDTLARELAEKLDGGERILIPRALKGNENIVPVLKEKGASVDDIGIYETVYESSPADRSRKELKAGNIDCVVFTSASTVKGFVESTKGADYFRPCGRLHRKTDKGGRPISSEWRHICRRKRLSAVLSTW